MACGAGAQPLHGHGGPGGHWHGPHGYYVYRGRDVHRFGHNDFLRWRSGRWNHTCFGGRCGWWWLSAGMWYFYTQPIYPYPVIVSGIQYAEPVVVPGPAVVTAPPIAPQPTPIAPPPQFWYYCDNPPGYFPTVQNCNSQFRQVNKPPPH